MTRPVGRLIVVLGYSDDGRDKLHPVCAERVARAATIATADDVVVLSGWARVSGTRPEAELMAEAWDGSARQLVLDPDAQTTVGNAMNTLDHVTGVGFSEVVVVTSRWHAPRAAVVFRWQLRATGVTVSTVATLDLGSLGHWLRELPRWAVLPLQLVTHNGLGQLFGLRRLAGRGAMLLGGAVSIYLVAPTVLDVFASWNTLGELEPGWFLLVALTQLLAFASLWAVQRIALRTTQWRPVITSQLAGNAASRLIPGGAAAGTALQFRLLRSAGISTETATTGLTVSGLLQLAMTLVLPLIALPGVLLGSPAPDGLLRVAWAGVGLFVVLVVGSTAVLADDRLLQWIGHSTDMIRRSAHGAAEAGSATGVRLLTQRDGLIAGLDGQWVKAVVLSAGRSAFDYLTLLAAITAFGNEGRLSLVLLAFASATLLGLVPLTPGGLGFVEAGLTGTLALAGLSAGDAISAALLYRLFSFWLPIPAGMLAGVYHQRYLQSE